MKVVAIGGGTGLAALLRGLKDHVAILPPPRRTQSGIERLTAIVTVTDEGGSSGRLRRDFGMLPPGDIRNCLVALAEDERILTKLFDYRFRQGHGLRGHSLGNLFLTALAELTGDFAAAVKRASEVLAVRGEIFPATLADVRLRARLADGRRVEGEARISRTRVRIEHLSIFPEHCRPLPETLQAIEAADLITLGPGSLYTSLIPNLLVRGIPEQVSRSRAVKVYIGNLMTQPGETRRYTAADHIRALVEHAGSNLFDYAVLNTRPLPPMLRRRYAAERAEPVLNNTGEVCALGVQPIYASLLARENHVARHDSSHLARLLLRLAAKRR